MPREELTIQTADGMADCTVHLPHGTGPWPLVVFYMDGPGIRPSLRGMADRLASLGYFTFLPNLFYRGGSHAPFDARTAFDPGPERERLMGLIGSIDRELVMRDTASFFAHLARDARADLTRVACVGYCMGGKYALAAAGTFPDRVYAAASIHGGGLATDRPDSVHLLAPAMRATIYVGVAEIDRGFSAEERERLRAALESAGVRYAIEIYPGARHGFAVPDMPVYDEASAERHWVRLRDLLALEL
jgi:carboxymethylenebutenolidase